MTTARLIIEGHRAARRAKLRARNSKRTASRAADLAERARRAAVRDFTVYQRAQATARERWGAFLRSPGFLAAILVGVLLWALWNLLAP